MVTTHHGPIGHRDAYFDLESTMTMGLTFKEEEEEDHGQGRDTSPSIAVRTCTLGSSDDCNGLLVDGL